MITTTVPAAPTVWARIRRALGTTALIPVFLVVLALGLFEGPMTPARAATIWIACWALAAVLVTR
jgi:hypothetical protein